MATTDRDIRVCQADGAPLVFTLEFPGAEYVCVLCGGTEGIFGERAEATTERQLRLTELTERYERERAERRGETYTPRPKVGDPGVVAPTCGCGARPPDGVMLDETGKPAGWYGRTIDGRTDFACSAACIPSGDRVMPW